MIETNIYETWRTTLDRARQDWRASVLADLEPELNQRGITVDSRTGIETGADYSAIWYCSKGEVYMEITANVSTAFTVKVIIGDKTEWWPVAAQSTYDRQNYTVKQLIDWLDAQPWVG